MESASNTLRSKPGASRAAKAVLIGGYLLMLSANLPGHMSFDSVMSLYEGRFQRQESWNPPLFGWLLGRFDELVPGTALYVVASGLLLFGGWMWLFRMQPRVSWLGVAVAAGLVLTPQVLIYQGIVWKDVFFANAAVFGTICLAHAARDWARARERLALLGAAALMFAIGASARQNGVLALAAAALGIAWTAGRNGGWRSILAHTFGWLAAAAVFGMSLTSISAPAGADRGRAVNQGVRLVQHYDLAGFVARDPTVPLPGLHKADPAGEAYLRANAARFYSPQRVDFLDDAPRMGDAFWALDDRAMRAEWLGLIARRPDLYVRIRLDDFRWLVAPPRMDRCLPVFLGVQGAPSQMRELRIVSRWDRNEQRLFNYTTWFIGTPAFAHWTYAIIALAVFVALARRRRPADIPVAAMLLGALGFTGSFLVISIACDYRYLYYLDLAAMTGLLYLAADPSGLRRNRT